eukprot:2823094-Rhodomonas_salina.1
MTLPAFHRASASDTLTQHTLRRATEAGSGQAEAERAGLGADIVDEGDALGRTLGPRILGHIVIAEELRVEQRSEGCRTRPLRRPPHPHTPATPHQTITHSRPRSCQCAH